MNNIEKLYNNKVILAIVVGGLVVLISKPFFPKFAQVVESFLIPAFIVIVCFEILIIRINLSSDFEKVIKKIELLEDYKKSEFDEIIKKTQSIKDQIQLGYQFKAFDSGEQFDDYLNFRVNQAKVIKVIHLNSFPSSSTDQSYEKRSYNNIIEGFLKSKKTFHRIYCKSDNPNIQDWIRSDLQKYEHLNHLIYYLDKIELTNIRTISVMIIDEEEVCLGGGYKTSYKHPTIAIKNKEIVQFYTDYFNYLLSASIQISSGDNVDWELFNKISS